MTAVADSTVVFHFNYHQSKILEVLKQYNINRLYITRIGYLEILSGASVNSKRSTRKLLQQFPILPFDSKAEAVAEKLAMKYRVSSKNTKDFFIASTAIAYKLPLITENQKDFQYAELKLLPYTISNF